MYDLKVRFETTVLKRKKHGFQLKKNLRQIELTPPVKHFYSLLFSSNSSPIMRRIPSTQTPFPPTSSSSSSSSSSMTMRSSSSLSSSISTSSSSSSFLPTTRSGCDPFSASSTLSPTWAARKSSTRRWRCSKTKDSTKRSVRRVGGVF